MKEQKKKGKEERERRREEIIQFRTALKARFQMAYEVLCLVSWIQN